MRNNLKIIFFRLSLVLIFYTVTRMIFVLNYPSAFEEVNFWDKALAGLYGVRFDLAITFILNLPIILFWSLPIPKVLNHPVTRKIVDGIFVLWNVFWLGCNLADMEYFKFSGRRSTIDIFWQGQDVSDQAGQLIWNFIHIIILITLLVFFFYRIYKANFSEAKFKKTNWWKSIVSILIVLVTSFVFIRGTTGSKSLRPGHAFVFKDEVLGHLALNTPFMVIRNLKKGIVNRRKYFKSRDELLSHLESNQNLSFSYKNHNVIIIIMESFALEYLGHDDGIGYMPFTLSLTKDGLFFPYNYANGRRSIEALPSILASIPNMSDHSFINSIYQSNYFNGIGDLLKEHGYHTSFFHGGKNGTLGFDTFSRLAGMDHYYGQFEFPDPKDEDISYWGIHDWPFFVYFADKLSTFPTPFVSAIFSLSSHQPYIIPPSFKQKVPKGYDDIKSSIYYADQSLRNFFERIKDKPWYKDTLFVITADHTSLKLKKKYYNEMGDYLVPLIFYHPSVDLSNFDNQKVTQHIDIVPSILDFLGIDNCKRILMGRSVFAGPREFAVNYNSDIYRIMTKKHVYHYSNEEFKEKIPEKYLTKLKAYIQYYNNSLIDNSLHKDGFCFTRGK